MLKETSYIYWTGLGWKWSLPNRGTIPAFAWKDWGKACHYIRCPGRDSKRSLERYCCLWFELRSQGYHSQCFKFSSLRSKRQAIIVLTWNAWPMKKLTWREKGEDGVTDSIAWLLHGTLLSAVLRQKTLFDGAATLWAGNGGRWKSWDFTFRKGQESPLGRSKMLQSYSSPVVVVSCFLAWRKRSETRLGNWLSWFKCSNITLKYATSRPYSSQFITNHGIIGRYVGTAVHMRR
jgi:hypothetical protein